MPRPHPDAPAPLVVVLCKPPGGPDCKTRLAADLGRPQATEIYEQCLGTALRSAVRTGSMVRIAVAGQPLSLAQAARDNARDADLVRQVGATFAERQRHEIARGLGDGFRPVALMASDLAEPADGALEWALTAAVDGATSVVPAPDGGYSILATSTPLPELAAVPMSSERTLDLLRAALERHGRVVAVADRPLADIDTGADVRRLLPWPVEAG